MKKWLVILLLFASVAAIAQFGAYQIPLWNGRTYTWLRLSPNFTVVNGVLDVAVAQPAVKRVYNVVLTWDSVAGGYPVKSDKNVVVSVNGLIYSPGIDYEVAGGFIKPISTGNWPPPELTILRVDYDQ